MDDEELLRQRQLGAAKLRELREAFEWARSDEGKADLAEALLDEDPEVAETVREMLDAAEPISEWLNRELQRRDRPESN